MQELAQCERPTFESKMLMTDLVIKKAINKFGNNCAVSWSGGKDSTLVLYRALKQKPSIKVLFENTLIEFPETMYFIRALTKEWNLNLIETKPLNGWTFRKCLDKYGLPKPRQSSKQGKQRTPKCCLYLKEQPGKKAVADEGIECLITGMTTAESETRGFLNRYNGCGHEKDGLVYTSFYYFTKDWNAWKFNPIMNWTEKEVFEVHKNKKEKIPLCPVYSICGGIYKRCGCKPCTAYLDWEVKLSKSDPLLYAWLKTYEKNQYQPFSSLNDDKRTI